MADSITVIINGVETRYNAKAIVELEELNREQRVTIRKQQERLEKFNALKDTLKVYIARSDIDAQRLLELELAAGLA